MEVRGKYGSAIIYNDEVEQGAISQMINLLNQPTAENGHVRGMPDIHSGTGCVIGYTAHLTDKVIPNLIGVDIGCGIIAFYIGKRHQIKDNFDKLEKLIFRDIPSGNNIREHCYDTEKTSQLYNHTFRGKSSLHYNEFINEVKEVAKRTYQDENYVLRSLGTLGGGNHFIEVDETENHDVYLTIHTGSRNFGLKICMYHQRIAENRILGVDEETFKAEVEKIKRTKKGKEIEVAINELRKSMCKKGKASGLEYLDGEYAKQYFHDMDVAQKYATLNRAIIGSILLKNWGVDLTETAIIESVHNYINFSDKIVRKGAISAHENEMVIIPMNMEFGIILGKGKGNPEWNNSAPHGAGRIMGRNEAKKKISLESFQERMKRAGVWTNSVNKHTLDEAPQAYKDPNKIIEYIKPTVDIVSLMKPIYNFKAGADDER